MSDPQLAALTSQAIALIRCSAFAVGCGDSKQADEQTGGKYAAPPEPIKKSQAPSVSSQQQSLQQQQDQLQDGAQSTLIRISCLMQRFSEGRNERTTPVHVLRRVLDLVVADCHASFARCGSQPQEEQRRPLTLMPAPHAATCTCSIHNIALLLYPKYPLLLRAHVHAVSRPLERHRRRRSLWQLWAPRTTSNTTACR